MEHCNNHQSQPVLKSSRWIFTRSEINNAPSVRHYPSPISTVREHYMRKLCINLILHYDLVVSNPQVSFRAAVCAHRFYMVYPFQTYCLLKLSAVCIFEARKKKLVKLPIAEIYNRICNVTSCPEDLSKNIDSNLKRYETTLSTILANDTYFRTPSLPFHPDPMYREKDLAFYNTCVYLCLCSTSFTTLILEHGVDMLFYACVCLVQRLTGYPLANAENGGLWYTSTRIGVSASGLENLSELLKSLFEKESPEILQLVSQMPFGKELHETMIKTQIIKIQSPSDCIHYNKETCINSTA